jgi:hypothetical protein
MLKAVIAALLLLGAGSSAFAKTKTYTGPYTISFFNDPGSVAGSQICLELTPSAPIAGFPTSGTFVDTDGDGISGQYVLDGKVFHLIMLVTGFSDNVDAIGPIKGKGFAGNYDDFYSGYNSGANTDISSGTFTLTPTCAAAPLRRRPTQHSITR